MKFSFTLAQLENHALNDSRKWEFMNACRFYLGIKIGQSWTTFDAIDFVSSKEFIKFSESFGRDQHDRDIVLHALQSSIAFDNFKFQLREVKSGGANQMKSCKALLAHFKDMLERTEW
jgi:hypothetical protein